MGAAQGWAVLPCGFSRPTFQDGLLGRPSRPTFQAALQGRFQADLPDLGVAKTVVLAGGLFCFVLNQNGFLNIVLSYI